MIRFSVVLTTTSDFLLRPVFPFSRALKWFWPLVRFRILPFGVRLKRLAVALWVLSFGIVMFCRFPQRGLLRVLWIPFFKTLFDQRSFEKIYFGWAFHQERSEKDLAKIIFTKERWAFLTLCNNRCHLICISFYSLFDANWYSGVYRSNEFLYHFNSLSAVLVFTTA